ncbi:Stk1 family PASTA domain-containing Ser/Thr kinase [Dermabacter sp. HSID17554]|uniref:Stk1 family PASTA domain-containing Ser/Thr kinase n=1 Tax=Dermabacter sp. HSID17554 TaxID=2419511 RepID=UPI001EE95BB7|nr:Stk1 family PASTA domain-containing Ser/Thr kinase [Dermabacter sp. HSID17554]
MSTESSSPDIGLVLSDRYRIEHLIARGGMATVYRGFDERLHRPVALKIMHPHLADNPEFISRFSREARSAARLTHPHVVNVYDQGEDQGRVYLAMQLVEGETLRDELRREKTLTLKRALRVGRDVLAALDAAHRSGIIHRDIKPENVLVNAERDILVADFGLARAVGSATTSATGTMLGTVAYVSPEVVTRGVSDARSDLYSWGIMMFEMLVGRTPFQGDSAVHIAYQHAHEDIPAPSQFAPGVPASVDSIITWAASRLPASRPTRAHEVLLALDDILDTLSAAELAYRAQPAVEAAADDATANVPRLTRQIPPDAKRAVAPSSPASPPSPSHASRDGASRAELFWEKGASSTLGNGASGSTSATARKSFTPGEKPSDSTDPDESIREVALTGPCRSRGAHTRDSHPSPLLSALAIVSILALLAASIFGALRWYNTEGPGGMRTVPLVAGAPLSDAEAALQAEDLDVTTAKAYSNDVPAGRVISSDPATGTEVHKGTPVRLTLSLGQELFDVPQVQGQPISDATSALADAGFESTETRAYSSDVPKDSVISQEPADTSLPHGANITLTVSDGPEPIEVPSVAGSERKAAIKALEDAGLVAKVTEQYNSKVPAGQVISQDPAGATSALPGSEVKVSISLGPNLVDVPDVFRKSEADARAALEGAGLKVEVVYERGTPVFDLVSQQSQPGGTKVPRGSTVTITVY